MLHGARRHRPRPLSTDYTPPSLNAARSGNAVPGSAAGRTASSVSLTAKHIRVCKHPSPPAAGLSRRLLSCLDNEGPISRSDRVRDALYMVAFAGLGLAAPNILFRDKDSPYAFRPDQVGPYTVEVGE